MTTIANIPYYNSSITQLQELLAQCMKLRINITPAALLALEQLRLPQLDFEKFIQKLSFTPDFNNLLTLSLLQKEFTNTIEKPNKESNTSPASDNISISNNSPIVDTPLVSSNRSVEVKSESPPSTSEIPIKEQKNVTEIPPSIQSVQKPTEIIVPNSSNSSVANNSPSNRNTTNNIPSITTPNINPSPPVKLGPIIEKRPANIPPLTPEMLEEIAQKETQSVQKGQSQNSPTPGQKIVVKRPILPKKKRSEDDEEGSEEENEEAEEETPPDPEIPDELIEEDPDEIAKIREAKRKQWDALQIRQSTSTFRAIASEYSPDFKIVSEPTGKIFSDGKLEDFYNVQIDKFNKLKAILVKRPEGSGTLDINYINKLQNSTNVKFIGMVIEKRITQNKNYMISMEDPTGKINILIRQTEQQKELYELMQKVLPDHVAIVEGFLNVDAARKSRIVLASNFIFPDTKKSHVTNLPEEDIAVALISDTHFGSTDWMEKVWKRFSDYLNCRIGNDRQIEQAGKIKYLCIAGDVVDGIGVYPNQEKRLTLQDIYQQYDFCAKCFAELPDYITIVTSPGDHDSVRKALPAPAIPKDIAPKLYEQGVKMVGCPAYVSLHGVTTLLFHGTSLIDMNMSIPGLKNEDPAATMSELMRARHLVPSYGKKTELAPTESDWLVIDPIPDIFLTGHLHKNGYGWHNGILMVNSGCFQGQTDYMKSFGIDPDIGKPTIVNLKGPQLKPYVVDLIEN